MNNKKNNLLNACQNITENCIGCRQCVDACEFLQEIGEDPITIAERGPSVEEAYSCSLCGLCEQVCPVTLSMKNIFYEKRIAAVENREIDLSDYRYLLPDRNTTPQSLYRELNNIHYNDLAAEGEVPVLFFPGCTMLTYADQLVRALYAELQLKYEKVAVSMDCCGLPLYQLGMTERGDTYVSSVKTGFQEHRVKTLIVSCPNCYYQWRPILKDMGITLLTIYEALADTNVFRDQHEGNNSAEWITVHDSCPDRVDGIFARQTREALLTKGYQLSEMAHSREMSPCCGSGGHVSHFSRPHLADNLRKGRMEEACNSKAEKLTAYCLSCVLNFAKESGANGPKVQHVLNLLLGLDQDFSEVKRQAKEIFEGPEGETNWNRVMSDE
ncbi:(Fe-S)-binding protein [Dehalobacter sp. DCM]|uniref:(Fe-S)-binding protein n=1 Tax=Dehalobacter sp. DCM TaxID=2907827 RepID=UPI00308148B3|nr:(Fe-S)-binding protein [Dehalobacter sp. DCM]